MTAQRNATPASGQRSQQKLLVIGVTLLTEVCSGVIQPQRVTQNKTHFLIQPGWQNSGPHHWQTLWEARLGDAAMRVPQLDWMVPECTAWAGLLERTILQAPQPVVVLAHSIGCMATIFAMAKAPVAAAVLVAPADAERSGAPGALQHLHAHPDEAARESCVADSQR